MSTSAPAVTPHSIVDPGLGNSHYLLDLGDGSALAVDPPRDLRGLVATADRHGLRIRYAADTHLHADFLSAARELADRFGTTILASASGRRQFAHRGLTDGDEVDLGGLRLTALATPGHTDEHLSYLLTDGERPVGVFSGGSLIVGSAARTDLLGEDRTDALTRAQYRSLHRLARLPPETALWPTHGAGSFCSAPPGTERTSTIGAELAANPLLRLHDEDSFVQALLASLGSYPDYFRRLTEINRQGPALLSRPLPEPAPLSVPQVQALRADGAVIIDVRSVRDYAAGHIHGAVSIPLRDQFATWLGWLVKDQVIIVRNPDQDTADITWPAASIGVDDILGELDGGIAAWTSAGEQLVTTALLPADTLDPARQRIIDVRQDTEHAAGHLPRTEHTELGTLHRRDTTIGRPIATMCGHGERAATAASLLERQGHTGLTIVEGGPDDWTHATGNQLATT